MTNKTENTAVAVKEKTVADSVLGRLNEMQKIGRIQMPPDYSPANALTLAWLILQEVKDKDKKPVLQSCTQGSVAEALLNMCVQGLDASKKHGSFIAYGNRLTFQKEYAGNIALAKRVGMKDVNAQVIYNGDEFEYGVDVETGIKKLIKHKPDIANIANDNIIGAYAVTIMEDGTRKLEVMNIDQIKKSWAQGQMRGEGAVHKNFADQMAIKTVINRATKLIIRGANDSYLSKIEDLEEVETIDHLHEEITDNANKEEIAINLPEPKHETKEAERPFEYEDKPEHKTELF